MINVLISLMKELVCIYIYIYKLSLIFNVEKKILGFKRDNVREKKNNWGTVILQLSFNPNF